MKDERNIDEEGTKAYAEIEVWTQEWVPKFQERRNVQKLLEAIAAKGSFLDSRYPNTPELSYRSWIITSLTVGLEKSWPEGNELIVQEANKKGISPASNIVSGARLFAESCLRQTLNQMAKKRNLDR